MWYEVLPPMTIILAGLGLPQIASHYLCIYIYGTPVRRLLAGEWDMLMFMRDQRLCDQPMIAGQMGLENIPDE